MEPTYYGHAIVYPPIRESTDQYGTVYIAELGHGPVRFRFLDPLPLEEAQSQVREALRQGLREGRYYTSDFYPQAAMEHRYYYPEDSYQQDANDMELGGPGVYVDFDVDEDADADVDWHDMELGDPGVYVDVDEDADVDWHGQQCFGGVPASGEAIVSLPETSVKEGDCSVCLESFEAGNNKLRLRMMPCAHSFHEQCIFDWLSVSHVCPLCRFPLPT